ncbi:MAG: general secretion pathway protein GspK [Myxococcales bacterium]|nr:MAG: general secretion pathway protein GspK [Myxococcales bacterium]
MSKLLALLTRPLGAPRAALGARARRLRARRRRRGVALILVLSSLTILTVMLSEVQDESAAELGAALTARDQVVAEYAAKSAINLSRLLIAAEPTIRKTLAPLFLMMKSAPPQIPVWEFTDRVMGAFNDAEGAEAFKSLGNFDLTQGKNLGLTGAGFEIKVVDEDSKINLNEPARGGAFGQSRLAAQLIGLMGGPQNNPLFEGKDADGAFSDRQSICSAVVDWTDPDSETFVCDPNNPTAQSAGAEDSFYERLVRPYSRKNAAFDSLEELHKLRGFDDDFWATFIEPDPDRPEKRTVTVWGQGTINVNTANPQTLLAFICSNAPMAKPCNDPAEATKFLMMVTMLRGMMAGVPLFSSPDTFINALSNKGPFGQIFQSIGMEPVPFLSVDQAKKMISVESKLFSIYATGVVKSGKRETRVRIHTVVDFRNAPPPGTATQLAQAAQLNNLQAGKNAAGGSISGAPLPGANGQAANLNDPATAMQALLKPTPGGSIIHYKIE